MFSSNLGFQFPSFFFLDHNNFFLELCFLCLERVCFLFFLNVFFFLVAFLVKSEFSFSFTFLFPLINAHLRLNWKDMYVNSRFILLTFWRANLYINLLTPIFLIHNCMAKFWMNENLFFCSLCISLSCLVNVYVLGAQSKIRAESLLFNETI